MRVGVKVGPFYLSQSTRSRSRRSRQPTEAQLRAQAAARAAQRQASAARVADARAKRQYLYGPVRLNDPRTWHSGHTVLFLVALAVVFALPAMVGDGPVAIGVWAIAVCAGLIAWMVWLARRVAAERPAFAARRQQYDDVRFAAERERAAAIAAHQAYLALRQVGPNVWTHGACTINHRSPDTASRCTRGGT